MATLEEKQKAHQAKLEDPDLLRNLEYWPELDLEWRTFSMGNQSFVQPLHHGDQDSHQIGQRHYRVHQMYQIHQVSPISNGM